MMMTTTAAPASGESPEELLREVYDLRDQLAREERFSRTLSGRLAAAEKENAELRRMITRLVRLVPDDVLRAAEDAARKA